MDLSNVKNVRCFYEPSRICRPDRNSFYFLWWDKPTPSTQIGWPQQYNAPKSGNSISVTLVVSSASIIKSTAVSKYGVIRHFSESSNGKYLNLSSLCLGYSYHIPKRTSWRPWCCILSNICCTFEGALVWCCLNVAHVYGPFLFIFRLHHALDVLRPLLRLH